MHVLGVLFLLVLSSSCGKSDSNAGIPKAVKVPPKILPLDGSNVNGLYMAKFQTLNPHVNGTLPGSATIQRQDDKFFAYVRLFGGAAKAWHQQNIFEGGRCPTLADDLNQDGYIDVAEGEKVWGKILIPLDANLRSQAAGKNIYPVADESGSYFYERVTSFENLFDDLKSEDKNQGDNVRKLFPEEGLDIEGKVVVIQGTGADVMYPESVAGTYRRSPHQTLPIACGTFKQVTKIPGTPYDESDIPGPIGPVEEGPTETDTDNDVSAPTTSPDEAPRVPRSYEDDEEQDEWYDNVFDWWRSRWERSRAGRRFGWGDGF